MGLLLVTLSLFVIAVVARPKALVRLPSGERLSVGTLAAATVRRASDGDSTRIEFRKPWTLLVFMTPADCARCLGATGEWSALAERFKAELDVVGVIVHGDAAEARLYEEAYKPAFPVFVVADTEAALGIKELDLAQATPLKVLVDQSGRPVFASSASPDERAVAMQIARLLSGTP